MMQLYHNFNFFESIT